MPKIVEVPGLGNVEFPDSMSDTQIASAIETDILPKIGQGSAPTGRGGVLPSLAEGFVTGFTDVPLGVAGLFSAKPEETAAGKFSTGAKKITQDILGIDPTKEATTAEAVAGGLGSLASFLVPGTAIAKGAKVLGTGAKLARGLGYAAAGAQSVPLGTTQQIQSRMAEEAQTGAEVSPEDRLASQRLGGAIGLTDIIPLGRFMGPLEEILARVPVSKAGGVAKTVENAVKRALVSATEEGAQEAIAQGAQNLVEQGYYNPDLDITEGILSNAGVGGAAGGTLDVILQLMAGRKAGKMRTAFTQLEKENARQAAEKTPERIRAEAIAGRDELLKNAPSGEISIKLADNTEKGFNYKIVDSTGKPAATFSTKDAAFLAAEQYEKDSPGTVTFVRPTIAEAARTTKGKTTKQEKAQGKKIAKELKAAGALAPAPAQLPTTPVGQATTGAAIAETIQQVGATPIQAAEIATPAVPKKGKKKRIAPVEAPPPEGVAPPPVSTTAAEIPPPQTQPAISQAEQPAIPGGIPVRPPMASIFPSPAATVETPTAPQATPAVAPVSPTEAPPAAVQEQPAAKPPKEYKPSLQALFKPVVTAPEGVQKLQEFEAKKDAVSKALNARLAPIVGKNVRIQLDDVVRQGKGIAEGAASPAGDVIYLSYNLYDPNLTTDQMVDKLFDVMNHEVIHSLSNLGLFKGGELSTLFKAAERTKYQGNQFTYYDRAVRMYATVEGYKNPDGSLNEEMIHEEAVAEMFRDARAGKLKLEGTPKGVFGRVVEFFKRLFNGYRDAKIGQIFKDIEAGKIGAREARAVEGGVRKLSALPEDEGDIPGQEGSDSTQRAITIGSYRKAANYIKENLPLARNVLDYGAGLGLGADAMREENSAPVDTYEINTKKWESKIPPSFTKSSQIKDRYDAVVSLNVVNVLEPELRDQVVRDIVKKVAPGGIAIIGSRAFKDDIDRTKNFKKAKEPKAYWVFERKEKKYVYQKGYDGQELVNYVKSLVPDGYTVEKGPGVGKTSVVVTAPQAAARKFSIAPAVETKEFKNWFKRSKVLDEQGKPLVVHHFGSFNEDEDIPRSGMHFGTRQAAIDRATGKRADDAAMGVETYQNDDGLWHFDTDGVTSEELGFVGFQDQETALAHGRSNVLEMIANDDTDPLELGTVTSAYLSMQNPKRMADLGGANGEWDQAIAQAKSEGYDGIVYRNQYEDKGSDSYIAFKATQIKSTSNRGTFSPEEENIKLSVIPSITTEIKTAVDIAENVTKSGEATQADVDLANQSVRDAVRKLSTIPQVIPMPPEMEDANKRIFAATHVASTPGEKLMGVLGGISSREGIGRLADMFRVYYVQKTGQITKKEREAFLTGALNPDEAQFAEYSATQAADMMQRSSHYTVEAAYHGAPVIRGLNEKREAVSISKGADPNSAYMYIERDQADSPLKVLERIITGGPGGGDLTEQFRSYAVAQVSKRRLSEGKEIPEDITQEYIDAADALAEQYPIIKEAFESYQRFNTKLLEAVRDSGYLSQELFEEFTDQQNYYSMYRQLEEGDVVQETSGGLASRIRFKPYEGSTTGNLMADPIVAMMHNVAFWNNVILRTLATQKAFRVGEATGVVKRLRAFEDEDGNVTIETPSRADGFDDKTFYTYINGVEVPFASRDPLFTIGLSGNDFASPSLFLELAGMPANFLREMVTRDPGFMVANLMRDSVSTWVLAGSGANPFQTFKGFVSALNSSASFEALRSYGIVGSFDEAQKPMAKIVAGMRKKLTRVQGLPNMTSALTGAWDKLGSWSEASDAATRIAVYDAAKRDGASDFTAAYRALSIMNFSRSGHSAGLRMWTRMVPFLNARIQGFDVLYTGMKAAAGVVTGREQLSFERQRGTHVLVRGMALTAAAMALSLLLEDDEDYQQLPQYIKDANILIPIPGQKGQYFQIPKPFEAGFLFMTVPQTFYDVAMGNRSMRSATKLMFNQFSSTFGFNPIPQAALPIVENMINRDFYTGQPLVSPGMEQLDPSLQYNASTSYVARGLSQLSGFLPFNYDFEEGRFVPISPIKLDNLISGYGGPIMSYIGMGIGGAAYMFGSDNQGLPVAGSQLPVIRRFFVDARDKQPQAATEAYELYQLVDKVNRTISRLKKMGDTEALREYREENINVLRVGKQVRKMADNLNNIRAQIRRLEADKVTPMSQKLEKLRELRSREARVTQRIDEINQQLGR